MCQVPKPQQSKVTDKPRQEPDLTSLRQKYQLEYQARNTPERSHYGVFLTWSRTNNKQLVDPDFIAASKQQPSAHKCRQIETCIGPSCNSVSRETNPQPRQASAARWLEPLAKISIQDGNMRTQMRNHPRHQVPCIFSRTGAVWQKKNDKPLCLPTRQTQSHSRENNLFTPSNKMCFRTWPHNPRTTALTRSHRRMLLIDSSSRHRGTCKHIEHDVT